MTLAGFLLERIAEDEAWARDVGGTYYSEPYDNGAPAHHERLLAECEAKRRIVALHDGEHECVSLDRHDAVLVAPGFKYWLDPTLLHLASVYADHPDFQGEWRV